jgi:hypothetical protein
MHTGKLKYKELKGGCCLEPAYEAPLLNSLKATTIELGLLMNFGNEPMFKRLIYVMLRKQACFRIHGLSLTRR